MNEKRDQIKPNKVKKRKMDLTPASSEDPGAFDLIQETIGPFGKWQLIVWILTTMTNLPSAWHQVINEN